MLVERVHRHIYYRVGNRADAEDLTQQVSVNAWKALPKYHNNSKPFIAWLLTISNNLVIDFYRKNKDSKTNDIDNYTHFSKKPEYSKPRASCRGRF